MPGLGVEDARHVTSNLRPQLGDTRVLTRGHVSRRLLHNPGQERNIYNVMDGLKNWHYGQFTAKCCLLLPGENEGWRDEARHLDSDDDPGGSRSLTDKEPMRSRVRIQLTNESSPHGEPGDTE